MASWKSTGFIVLLLMAYFNFTALLCLCLFKFSFSGGYCVSFRPMRIKAEEFYYIIILALFSRNVDIEGFQTTEDICFLCKSI